MYKRSSRCTPEREVYSKQAGAAAAPSKWDGERAVAVALVVLVVAGS